MLVSIQNDKKSVIDYLLVQEQLYSVLGHFEIGTKWPETDHRPIIFHFNVKRHTFNGNSEKDNTNKYKRFYWGKNSTEKVRNCLFDTTGTIYAQNFYDAMCNLETPDIVGDLFSQFINQACERSLKQTKSATSKNTFPKNPWFDSECKSAKAVHKDAQTIHSADSDIVTQLGKDFKKLTRKKKRIHQRRELSDIMKCKNRKELWAKLNSLNRDTSEDDTVSMQEFFEHFSKLPIENTDNKFEFDQKHQSEMFDFFRKFNLAGENISDHEENKEIRDILDSIISEEEINAALTKLKTGKSPGLDGVPIEIFKTLEKELMPMLTKLFNYIVEMGKFPENWASGCINPVPKNSSPETADQFRRISVLPAINKIFDTIINTRFKFIEAAFNLKDPFNGGFETNSMTSDNIFILNGLIEKSKCQNKPLFVCFIDFKRAFDVLNRVFMFVKLIKQGYSCKMLDVIINMYSKTTSVIKWHGFLSDTFKDTMGVNQGGVTSPFLFKSFLKDLASDLDPELGIKVYNNFLAYVLWADDLFLVSDSAEKLQHQLDNLSLYCSKWQLVVNTMKTKILTFGRVSPRDKNYIFTFKNESIEIVKDYSYLGTPIFSGSNHFKKVVEHISQKCVRACYQIRQYCEPFGQVTPPLGMHFYESLLLPHIDYASEIWYSESSCRALEKFSLRYFKRLLHVRPNTPTLAVYGELGAYPVQVRLKCNVLKYRRENFSSALHEDSEYQISEA